MRRTRWELVFARICLAALFAGLGAALRPFGLAAGWGAACGLGAALFAMLWESRLRRATLYAVALAFGGALAGGVLGLILVAPGGPSASGTAEFFRILVPAAGAYLGLLAGAAQAKAARFHSARSREPEAKILDTSVLIDGRIADIAAAGFLDGRLIVPQFVLHELQAVADSSDTTKRNRGRRGLDLVQRMQNMPGLYLEISSQDFPTVREVDRKLIELAKARGAKIVTNDFNLNKLAQVQGIAVLNTNELANALKPVVLPGEAIRVFISKEGKEYNQGVAYLDDGTMVVVDNARKMISKTIDISVTSVLQTTAGRMIFGKYDERMQQPQQQRMEAVNQ